ncbi:MAG: FliH/SctL family protein [Suilimivivens sp.]
MIAQAKEQTAEIQKKAYEEAREDGYRDGERQGRQEAEAVKAEYQQKLKELQAAFEKEERELEPRFIEALTGIYEHIFKVDLSGYHELVTTLLCNTMQKIEGSRNLLIHVSGNDYENVKENKERLQKEAGGSAVSVEIAEDKTLSAGQAMIETENGVYDCSLDTELSELTRKLKLLSYEALK